MDLYEGMKLPGPDGVLSTKNRSWELSTQIDVPAGKPAQGVLVAHGGAPGGWVLYVKDGKPVFDWNYLAIEHFTVASTRALAPGKHTITYTFDYDGGGLGKGRTSKLLVDSAQVATGKVPRTECCAYGIEGMEVGMDMATSVSDAYP